MTAAQRTLWLTAGRHKPCSSEFNPKPTFSVTVRDVIIKIHARSRKVEQWGMCRLHQISPHLRVSALFARGQWDLLSWGKGWGSKWHLQSLWATHGSLWWKYWSHLLRLPQAICNFPWLDSSENSISASMRTSLSLNCSVSSCRSARSLVSCRQEGGEMDGCHDCFDPNWSSSPFALAVLRYTRIRDLGNACNSTAQPSYTAWEGSRVADPPHACQSWVLDSLMLMLLRYRVAPYLWGQNYTTLDLVWFYGEGMRKGKKATKK